LREERRLKVFENRVLRRVFGPKRDEVTGEWRELHNEELNDLYLLPNIVRVVKSRIMRWAGHVARMGEGRVVYRVLMGRPEGKRPLGRPRRRWEDNIKRDLQKVGGVGGDWMERAQDRDRWRALVSMVMKERCVLCCTDRQTQLVYSVWVLLQNSIYFFQQIMKEPNFLVP
jgi:hypothetical protein